MSPETDVRSYLKRTQSGRRKRTRRHKRTLPFGMSNAVPHEVEQGIQYGENFIYGFFDASGNIIGTPVTIVQDAMGNLHIWEGVKDIRQTGKYLFVDKLGKEAPLLMQTESDVTEMLKNVPQDAKESIEGGWTTFAAIPSEYLS